MKVRMLTAIAGSRWAAAPGEVVEMGNDEGKRFLAKGLAETCDQKEAAVCSTGSTENEKPKAKKAKAKAKA